VLDVGETWTYTEKHTVTAQEITSNGGGDGKLKNTAIVDTDETNLQTSSATVKVQAQSEHFNCDGKSEKIIGNFCDGDILDCNLGKGAVSPDPQHFCSGSTEGKFGDSKCGFWFDTANHTLYYDTNGNAAGGCIALACLENCTTLHGNQIHVS